MLPPRVVQVLLFDGKTAICSSIHGLLYYISVDSYYFYIRHELHVSHDHLPMLWGDSPFFLAPGHLGGGA